GTPLNDWGKKDAERLAFEDINAYLKDHYHLDNHNGKAEDAKAKKKPHYDNFFAEALFHRTREGYLHQKLLEPRSYDYNRIRTWHDRSRMPKFHFARTRKQEGEDEAKFNQRSEKEEADGREAVMTFVLGLVAEPIPAKYVHTPTPDRLAE